MVFCHSCGSSVHANDSFCSACGAALSRSQADGGAQGGVVARSGNQQQRQIVQTREVFTSHPAASSLVATRTIQCPECHQMCTAREYAQVCGTCGQSYFPESHTHSQTRALPSTTTTTTTTSRSGQRRVVQSEPGVACSLM
eukprot:m.290988 g.290988  ORF g.290988 m.290988 type:complete len:141 (+) comp12392_c0_seq1:175-597(+)